MSELKERVEQNDEADIHQSQKKLFEVYDDIINEMEKTGPPGYADVFTGNKSIIQGILGEKDKPFVAYKEPDFKKIEAHINTLESESTKSLYLRTFCKAG